jgi:hypothetical protein
MIQVRLLNPQMCEDCNFSGKVVWIVSKFGATPAIQCLRKDCDNWDHSSIEKLSERDVEDA